MLNDKQLLPPRPSLLFAALYCNVRTFQVARLLCTLEVLTRVCWPNIIFYSQFGFFNHNRAHTNNLVKKETAATEW